MIICSMPQQLLIVRKLFIIVFILFLTAAQAKADDELNILFIGNSFTAQGPIPDLVRDLASDAGWSKPFVDYSAPPGTELNEHLYELNGSTAVSQINIGNWDYVVLQEYSTLPTDNAGDPDQFKENATALYDLIKNANPFAKVVLYETWARHPDDSIYPGIFIDPTEMQAQLNYHYNDAADNYIPANSTSVDPYDEMVAPVGEAWENHFNTPSTIRLHALDNYHADLPGRYLTACVIYSTLYNRSVAGRASLLGLSDDVAAFLQNISDLTTGQTIPGGPANFVPGETIQIDYGGLDNTSDNWNNINDSQSGYLTNAITSTGELTDVSIGISERFGGINSDGISENDLSYPGTATEDSFYAGSPDGHLEGLANPAQVIIGGLYSSRVYTITFFASRTGDDGGIGRLTRYSINGDWIDLEVSDNTLESATFNQVAPDPNGNILIDVGVSPDGTGRYAYLGILEIHCDYSLDTTPPSIILVNATESTVRVMFDEDLDNVTAEQVGRYSINGGIAVTGALLDDDSRTVMLETSAHAEGNYEITVDGIEDIAGNAMPQTIFPYAYFPVSAAGLMGYWNFEEGSGTTAADSSGNGNTGILINGPIWMPGGEISFDGVDDYVDLGNNSFDLTNELTVSLWVNFNSITGDRQVIIQKGLYVYPFMMRMEGTGIRTAIRTTGGSHYLNSNTSLSAGEWYHVVLTYQDGSMVIYINGQEDSRGVVSGALTVQTSNTTIGSTSSGGSPLDGAIDDVLIYNRALTADEILSLFNGNQPAVDTSTGEDTTPPSIILVNATESTVRVMFDEDLDNVTAEQVGRYSINGGIAVTGALLDDDSRTVMLETSAHAEGNYEITVDGIEDIAGNAMPQTIFPYAYFPVSAAGLMGYWNFEEGSGTTAADSSGNGNTGILINGPIWMPGGEISFDGVDDYVDLGNNSFDLTNELTVSLWVNFNSITGDRQVIIQKGLYVYPFMMRMEGTGIRTAIRTTGGSHYLNSNTSLSAGEWYHVVLTYQDGSMVIYINGQEDSRGVVSGALTVQTSNTTIGSTSSGGSPLDGAIDDVLIYNRALTADEILSLFNGNQPAVDTSTGEDTTPPSIILVNATESTVRVMFDEDLDNVTAEQVGRYSINGGIAVTGALLDDDSRTVMLETSAHAEGNYEITVDGIEDIAGNAMPQTIFPYAYFPVSAAGLMGYWNFEEGSGTTAADSSGNGNTGILINGPIWMPGGEISFDGVDDYVDLGNNSFDLTNELTVSLWVNFNSITGDRQVIIQKGLYVYPFMMRMEGTGIRTAIRTTGGSHYLNSNTSLSAGEWYHVVLTYQDGSMVIYINGQEDSRGVVSGALTVQTSNTTIGSTSSGGSPLDGAIDDVLIYNRALTADEILSLFNGNQPAVDTSTGEDTTPPSIILVNATESTVRVMFDEDLDNVTAEQVGRYSINGGIAVTGALLDDDSRTVMLETSAHAEGNYEITVDGIEDIAGNAMPQTIFPYAYFPVSAAGLMGYWNFEEGSGTTAADSSGNGNTGILINGPIWMPGGEISFDGVDDYVDLGNNSFDLTNELTVSLWVNFNSITGDRQVIIQKGLYVYPFMMRMEGTGIRTAIRTTGGSHYLNSNTSLSAGEWYHVVLTYQDGSMVIYINGQEDSRGVVSGALTVQTSNTTIGSTSSGGSPLDGAIDDVLIYNRALTADEILSLFLISFKN